MHRSPIPEPDVASGPPAPGDERHLWRVAATNSGMKAARQALFSDEAAECHWNGLTPAAREDAKALAESFARDGTQIWTQAGRCWPLRGCDEAPSVSPILFVRGPRRLLADKGIGICGSRDASERGLRALEFDGAESPQGNVELVVAGAHPVASAHGSRRWHQSA